MSRAIEYPATCSIARSTGMCLPRCPMTTASSSSTSGNVATELRTRDSLGPTRLLRYRAERVRSGRGRLRLLGEMALRVLREAVDLLALGDRGEQLHALLGLEQEPRPRGGSGGPAHRAPPVDVLRDLLGQEHRVGAAGEERLHVAKPARVRALDGIDPEVVAAGRIEVDELVRVVDHAEMELVLQGEVNELHGRLLGDRGTPRPDNGCAGSGRIDRERPPRRSGD